MKVRKNETFAARGRSFEQKVPQVRVADHKEFEIQCVHCPHHSAGGGTQCCQCGKPVDRRMYQLSPTAFAA